MNEVYEIYVLSDRVKAVSNTVAPQTAPKKKVTSKSSTKTKTATKKK